MVGFPGVARAADAIDLSVESPAMFDQSQPALVLRIREPVEALRVRLAGPHNVGARKNWTNLRPGARVRLEIAVPRPGTYPLEGDLVARFEGGATADMPLAFEVRSLARLEFEAHATPEGVEAGRLRVTASGGAELSRYSIAIYGRDAEPLVRDEGRIGPDGEIAWSPPETDVLRIVLTVYDAMDRFREVTLHPWRVDVPHQEVHFPSGSAEIPESETPKLQASLAELRQILADYGRWAPVKLYIAGHTDTVGSGDDNAVLSQHRARAIARWFRAHGVTVLTFFAGFGERQLAVPTEDGVDEPKNRRAEYIVAVDPPPKPAGAPGWIRVR